MTDDESGDFSPDSLFHKFTIHIRLGIIPSLIVFFLEYL